VVQNQFCSKIPTVRFLAVPFKYTFRVEKEGTTVPYSAFTDDIRHNRGFVDLRGRPDRATEIAEGGASAALLNLLMQVASPDSPIFTLGCDLGSHMEPTNVPLRRRAVAGGYVQVAGIHYHRTPTEAYAALANSIVAAARTQSGKDNWEIDFVGKGVRFQFEGEPTGIQPSLWIWFFARTSNEFSAMESRERLITAISDTLVMPNAVEPFTAAALQIG
jgi:hypothetical protein